MYDGKDIVMKQFNDETDSRDTSQIMDSDESETFLYESVIENKNTVATPRSLLLAGPKSIYYNSNRANYQKKKGHRRSMSFAETVEPLTVTWNNINVFADVRGTGICGRSYKTGETRQIISNLTGIARPGKILAILGPSGSGKTTLLNVLNDRNTDDLMVDGEVKTNGQALGSGIKTVSAYVLATDIFIGNLKVKEHLWFYALMKMDNHFTKEDREARIEELLFELGLKKCAETYIGTPGTVKGISGGEMKRLSFASELLINPPIMFLDEPTSGLDSYMAENIMHILKKMARKNKTILCTIHQPNSEVYTMFDDILLMREGKTVYMGSLKGATNFFKSCGFPCPSNYNPADHFVHLIASKEDQNNNAAVNELSVKYLKTEEFAQITKSIAEINSIMDSSLLEQTTEIISRSKYKVSWCNQLRGLLWRHWINIARDNNLFIVRVGQTLFLSIMISLIFFQQNYNDPRSQFNLNGANFLQSTLMTYNIFFTVLNAFPSELPLFFREHSAGMYRVDAYFLSRNITDLLIFILMPTILSCFFFGLVITEHSLERFLIIWLTNIAVAKSAVSIGYFLSTATIDIDLSLAISPPILYLFMTVCGYLVNLNSIMIPFRYLQYISWLRYGYENLIINQWIDVHNVTCLYSNLTKSPCFSNGEDMIRFLGFTPSKDIYYLNFLMLLVIIVVLRLIAFICLFIRSKETKKYPKVS